MFAAKWRELLRFENIETGLNTGRVAGMFRLSARWHEARREKCGKNREMDKLEVRALESGQRVPRY